MLSPDVRIARIAARQYGVFTYDQALSCHFTADMIAYRLKVGRWQRLHRGVYLLVGTEVTFTTRVLGAVLAAGEGAVASFATAGALYVVEDFRPGRVEVTVPRRTSPDLRPVFVHRVDLPTSDKAQVQRVP